MAAPADVGFAFFQRLFFFVALAHFQLKQFGAQHFHHDAAVFVLRTAGLRLHDNARGNMGDAHGGVGFVDVLTACARCAVGVGAQIGGVDFNFKAVVHFGINKHGGERGVAFVVGIKRRVAHKAVHAGFGAQQAVGVFAFYAQGGVVDAGDFAVVLLNHFYFEAFALGVAGVHPQQHAGPVFGFGAACACGDVHKAVVGVGGLVEHSLKFQIRHLLFQRGNVGNNGGKAVGIVFFHRHVN